MAYMQRSELAAWGELTAKEFLEKRGVLLLANNYRNRYGEIDLIGIDADSYIFFEVKTRQSINFGFPEESVSEEKLLRIETVGWSFLEEKKAENEDWRIDIIAIIRDPKTACYEIQWIKNVSTEN
ncbi:MAG: YraN family protein [Chloroflexi bacterium HGW-Chloroflexi-10]|jgi:putative endonuclease|nr:MAG: YraN family protein [Chloroflexi bacterium HGW-Chloroflexi-10]